ncbi:MAG: 2-isopropylmalate synthase [Candidatus Hydrogenedentes bacterium]|nr:2-isopropylmalate synthase [Candidatus Hydrogenedentota bacterium]
MQKIIRVLDTTLRDGEQTPGVHLDIHEKVCIAQGLEALGVATIEAGFPASSPGDAAAVRAIAKVVRKTEVAALSRCVGRDIDVAGKALRDASCPVMHLVIGTSDIHMEHKLGMSRAKLVDTIAESVRHARRWTDTVQFSLEDATRSDPIFLRQCAQTAVEAGATRINIADTVGCMMPDAFGPMIFDMNQFLGPDIVVSAHCHNDMGLATANALAAVKAGARQIECTINGIGERAGNTALEEIAVILALKGVGETGIRLDQLCALSARVAEMTNVAVQPNRAIVGANAFTHSSGIHQDGILKAAENYQFVAPELVGKAGHDFVLTARSGRNAVTHVARSRGHVISEVDQDRIYAEFVRFADTVPGAVDGDDLDAIVGRVIGKAPVLAT